MSTTAKPRGRPPGTTARAMAYRRAAIPPEELHSTHPFRLWLAGQPASVICTIGTRDPNDPPGLTVPAVTDSVIHWLERMPYTEHDVRVIGRWLRLSARDRRALDQHLYSVRLGLSSVRLGFSGAMSLPALVEEYPWAKPASIVRWLRVSYDSWISTSLRLPDVEPIAFPQVGDSPSVRHRLTRFSTSAANKP